MRSFLRDRRGAGAAEFALILPLFLLFLLGIIDAGRFAWTFNQAEKATQIGARWAVVTDVIPGGATATGLRNYSFVSSSVPQGGTVNSTAFPGVYCQTNGATAASPLTCTCKGTCGFSVAPSDATAQAAWSNLVGRMQDILPGLGPQNVRIDYDWSGLGYAGDPNGPDVAPLVTVSLRTEQANRINFQPMTTMLFGGALGIPSASYTLTMEDGSGTDSN
jgi:Flp pilus assembly pilin Flp